MTSALEEAHASKNDTDFFVCGEIALLVQAKYTTEYSTKGFSRDTSSTFTSVLEQ